MTPFLDESGPEYDRPPRCVILGAVLCPTDSADQLAVRLAREAGDIANDFPALGYHEWKGSILGKTVSRAKRRNARKRGQELLTNAELPVVFDRTFASVGDIPGTRVLALTAAWEGPTPVAHGKDYRLSQATERLLEVFESLGMRIEHAHIDRGHETGYSRGFERFSKAGGAVPSYEWVDSSKDRRLQIADLVAHLGRTTRFPANQHLPGINEWLSADRYAHFVAGAANSPDHYVAL